jgi:hypothetical protein
MLAGLSAGFIIIKKKKKKKKNGDWYGLNII